ncbi:ABC transporter ATP-binding protein [Aquirufa ecclesiirivi]|uniref:ABC transporter ATP-binding protein n=1 Tax=Aquirufa ecclesiirivi TaxID=2715124 RepID=UPI0014076BF0|nr:ABC transporter ATP-binding protein [Aquirufa ecclesiirivi]MCZ2471734.1 ABC transporter ATP-binding protein [Aquirufa ecclesiirivi]NHC49353.1 ABC transporter ATP-binding protein [Aquirufa ecclesiirivi]
MKTYLRLLSYAVSIRKYVFPYFGFSFLASLFGILNFTLLIPLLNVLFNQAATDNIALYRNLPEFTFSPNYFSFAFNHYFYGALEQYGRIGALQYACGAIMVSVILSNIFRYFSQRVLKTVEADTIASLRQAVFERAIRLDLSYFSERKKGNLMSRLTTDVQEVENSIGRAFTATFKEIFSLVLFFVFLASMSGKLTLFSLMILPLSGGVIATITRRLRRAAGEVQQHLSGLISLLDETFGAMRVVKAFRAEPMMDQRFQQENGKYRHSLLKMVFRQELTSPVSESLGVLVVTGILLYGGTLVISGEGELSASTFIAFIATFSQVMRPAKAIADAFSGIQRGVASADRIIEILDTQPIIVAEEPIISKKELVHRIVFDQVNFAYQKDKLVLDHVSFEIPKGKTIALVGPSGGGKSTLADLLPRFYDPSSGQILIDEVPIKQVPLEDLRSMMGIVTQESVLFNDTIFNNIAFGTEASQEEVEEAAKIANAHDFIMANPEGYQAHIGDRGSKLSGGQRQRISIARAVLKNPPILILDEATSALDNESEKLVQAALTNLMKNRTVLVIAHRLSTIQHADQILVVQKGKIMERGTHEELMRDSKGLYAKLSHAK